MRCLPAPYQDVRGADVVLAGEVLSPANRQVDIEAKKARYATLLAGEWTPADEDGVTIVFPFPVAITWQDLVY